MKLNTFHQLLSCVFLILFVTFSTGCGSDDDLFTVDCPSFDNQKLEWFPYQRGSIIKFTNTDSALFFRDFFISDRLVFGDTTYQTLFEGEICTPSAEFLGGEEGQETTILNFRILDLDNNSGGTIIALNISDANTISTFTQQFLIDADGDLLAGENTTLTEIGDQTINGVLYEDIIRLDLTEDPEIFIDINNDVRSYWLAKGAGIVRFRDEAFGVFELEP